MAGFRHLLPTQTILILLDLASGRSICRESSPPAESSIMATLGEEGILEEFEDLFEDAQ
jgi:hypothetical protein